LTRPNIENDELRVVDVFDGGSKTSDDEMKENGDGVRVVDVFEDGSETSDGERE